jgi:hypothetical protein
LPSAFSRPFSPGSEPFGVPEPLPVASEAGASGVSSPSSPSSEVWFGRSTPILSNASSAGPGSFTPANASPALRTGRSAIAAAT